MYEVSFRNADATLPPPTHAGFLVTGTLRDLYAAVAKAASLDLQPQPAGGLVPPFTRGDMATTAGGAGTPEQQQAPSANGVSPHYSAAAPAAAAGADPLAAAAAAANGAAAGGVGAAAAAGGAAGGGAVRLEARMVAAQICRGASNFNYGLDVLADPRWGGANILVCLSGDARVFAHPLHTEVCGLCLSLYEQR